MQTTIAPHIQCPNPDCRSDDNAMGQTTCRACNTPLPYCYLWAIGDGVEKIPPKTVIGDRYQVAAPQVWLDLRPGQPPDVPESLPDNLLPYLQLYDYRLHLPTIYSFAVWNGSGVLLLENVPLNDAGQLLPAIAPSLSLMPTARKLYWLWQMLELWTPLDALGVTTSLLTPNNIRVEGWRIRLRSLYRAVNPDAPPTLADLADLWRSWLPQFSPPVDSALLDLCAQMTAVADSGAEDGLQAIAHALNQLLLEQAAQSPLKLSTVAASSTGPQCSVNEDTSYPNPNGERSAIDAVLSPKLAIVCDGIGGHAGGEVASQLAVRSLQLQLQALFAELVEQTEPWPPDMVAQQLEAIVRVVNNTISAQNDEQGRQGRDRMGTTLVLAVQLPQKVHLGNGWSNTHELYLINLGDSRAYWITPRYCHQLTVDDDLAGRDVRTGRCLYREALHQTNSSALTQALGTREADWIYPSIQRFMLDEDGVLLLCSDGLSDQDQVETHWERIMQPFFGTKASLQETAERWVELADEKNGHDNASVALMHCTVSPEQPRLFDPSTTETESSVELPDTEWSEAARALFEGVTIPEARPAEPIQEPAPRATQYWKQVVAFLVGMFLLGLGGTLVWQILTPDAPGERSPDTEEATPFSENP